ncbi:hypothetical protein BU17DRAFT_70686 [Hysterangium stoloniferum]|nr:hypothetical protein BU17DRAFT_70686 [Hysterangium stoloniferum]
MTYEPKLAQWPSIATQEIMKLMKLFSISPTQFQEAVKGFEAKRSLGSQASGRGWDQLAVETGIPSYYKTLDVWKMFRITLPVLDSLHDPIETRIIRAALGKKATVTQKEIPDVFDIVLVDTNPTSSSQQMGLQGLRVAQLQMIFRLAHINLKGPHPHPKHLAYVEWFDYDGYNSNISMYAVQKSYGHSGHQITDIIELDQVVQPCPLSPCFGEKASNLDPIDYISKMVLNTERRYPYSGMLHMLHNIQELPRMGGSPPGAVQNKYHFTDMKWEDRKDTGLTDLGTRVGQEMVQVQIAQ